jgi:hypothetical protein
VDQHLLAQLGAALEGGVMGQAMMPALGDNMPTAVVMLRDHRVMVAAVAPSSLSTPMVAVRQNENTVMTCMAQRAGVAAFAVMNRRGGGMRVAVTIPVMMNRREGVRGAKSQHRNHECDQDRDPAVVTHV